MGRPRSLVMTLRVDGGEPLPVLDLDVHAPPVVYARSEHAVKPDSGWRHVDTLGHAHAWQEPGSERVTDRAVLLPTLAPVYVHRDCDGSCGDNGCEGWGETEWHCRICGELIKPHYVPDWHARNVGDRIVTGPRTATIVTGGERPGTLWNADVPATVESYLGTLRGRAWLTAIEGTSDGECRHTWDMVIHDG